MGKFSDDPEVDAAVTAAEADYNEALDAYRENRAPEAEAAYKEAQIAFATARTTARAGRGMAITSEE